MGQINPSLGIISTRSRKLSLNRRYQRTQRTTISVEMPALKSSSMHDITGSSDVEVA